MRKEKVINGNVPIDFKIENNDKIMIISKDQSYLTHGIHKFPAKFFPELPRYLIAKYSKPKDIVIDPMCGSGTAILEALLQERDTKGIDIDPMAIMISKIKLTPINPKSLNICRKMIFREILEKVGSNYQPRIPDFHYRDTWFKPFVLRELGIIKESIDSIKGNDYSKKTAEKLHRFFMVVFSSIIRDISNADPHCSRTVIRKNLDKDIKKWDAVMMFLTKAEKQIDGMNDFYKKYNTLKRKPKVEILKRDARDTKLPKGTVGFAVTSPPYINAVDYPRTHQLELYWLGLADPKKPLSDMKRKYIGTEVVFKKDYKDKRLGGYKSLNAIIEKIYKTDPRRAYIVYKFFMDMETQLKEMFKILRKNGYYCVVIGNNTIRGHVVKSHKILSEIATSKNVGFKLEKMFYSGVVNHFIKIPRKERMLGEWVLVLKKP